MVAVLAVLYGCCTVWLLLTVMPAQFCTQYSSGCADVLVQTNPLLGGRWTGALIQQALPSPLRQTGR